MFYFIFERLIYSFSLKKTARTYLILGIKQNVSRETFLIMRSFEVCLSFFCFFGLVLGIFSQFESVFLASLFDLACFIAISSVSVPCSAPYCVLARQKKMKCNNTKRSTTFNCFYLIYIDFSLYK